MKSSIVAVLAGATLLASSAFAKEATTTLKVSGWHCQGCANKTETALKGVKGVKTAKADKKTDSVVVTYDDAEASSGDLEGAIAALHYTVAK